MSLRHLRIRKANGAIASINNSFSEDEKENKSSSPNCESGTVSSDFSQDDLSSKPKRRRKIRRTQDFQNIVDSFGEEEDKGSKHTSKTKKSKNVKYLPKIQGITEEFDIQRKQILKHLNAKKFSDENLPVFNSNQNVNEKLSSGKSQESELLKNKKKRTKRRTRHNTFSDENRVFDNVSQQTENNNLSQSDIQEVSAKKRRRTKNKKVQFINSNSPIPSIKRQTLSDYDEIQSKVEANEGGKVIRDTYLLESDLFETQKSSNEDIHNGNANESIFSNVTDVIGEEATNNSDSDSIEYNFKPRLDTGNVENDLCCNNDENAENLMKSKKLRKTSYSQKSDLHNVKLEYNKSILKSDVQELAPEKIKQRRGTYELDDSINDINLLKSLSVENTPVTESTCNNIQENINKHVSVSKPVSQQQNKRKRTFELENSMTDLEILKRRSCVNTPESDAKCFGTNRPMVNSLHSAKMSRLLADSSNISNLSSTSYLNSLNLTEDKSQTFDNCGSKITTRRKDKTSTSNNYHLNLNTSTKVDKHSLDICAERAENLDKPKTFNRTFTNSPLRKNNNINLPVATTPLSLKRGNSRLLKKAMENAISAKKLNISNSLNKSSTKKPLLVRTKMPDFSSIHKKAFERMESLEEMMQRKAERAKLLLSGSKPMTGSIKKPLKEDSPRDSKVKKQLQFGTSTSKQEMSGRVTGSFKLSGLENSNEVLESTRNDNSDANVSTTKGKFTFTKLVQNSPKHNGRSKIPTPKRKIQAPKEKATFESSNNISELITKSDLINFKSRLDKTKLVATQGLKKGYTRFGFKTTVAPAHSTEAKKEQLKAVANKTNIIKNHVEQRRNIIKGVRSNRRFELLMNMRKKT